MKRSSNSFFSFSLTQTLMVLVLGLMLYFSFQTQSIELPSSVPSISLEGSIQLRSLTPNAEPASSKIQPGTNINFLVDVTNKGEMASPSGELYVRYAFAKPLDKEEGSILFQTERKPLPEIPAGGHIQVTFDTPQTLPSLHDFMRQDWALRDYQAIAVIHGEEYLLGSLALTFSAYYYPGIQKKMSLKLNEP